PVVELVKTQGLGVVKTLAQNQELAEKNTRWGLGKKEFFSFKTPQNDQLNGWMLKPKNFDPGKKYPVLMYVYGGPGHQTVLDRWDGRDFYWYQYLAQQGYLVVSVDGRGTGGRGAAFKKSTYASLGKLELEDQVFAADYLSRLSYVDSARIGIWGWSFGGYLSSLCMTKAAGRFKMGIAVAPVTTWRFYDSIYTERFLKTPQDNAKGYDENSPINYADRLKGNYFLIHGTGDDNVHFQHAVKMQEALIKSGKQFRSFYYPDKNHGIYGGNTRFHLYKMMTDYILGNL
ncbi:MAG: prolyl oligopeptidase family serine peptidase, partial [Cytophagales bacterium]|nr:prolyl oligopeptidase family serine peptidase [Cytophagales bacterium]